MFQDRMAAASRLSERLQRYRGKRPLILAIPRGGAPMAKSLSDDLGGEWDVVLVRKLRAPHQAELAIGSVNEGGWTYLADHAPHYGADAGYIASEREVQLAVIRERRALYTPVRAPIDPADRIVIVVDDGLATGATMTSALSALREKRPVRLICAVPVAPQKALAKMAELADEVVCLETPENFQAVGQFYRHFPQVQDDEVIRLLRGA